MGDAQSSVCFRTREIPVLGSHLGLSGLLISMCRKPKKRAATKPDNTQTGLIELR